jgi:hypothetical protein
MKLKINIGFGGLLAILFVTLKLLNVIAWSWLWVLSPLWIGIAISTFIWFIFFVIASLTIFFGSR